MAGVSNGEVKVGSFSAPVVPLAMIGAGIYLIWFGIHYWARGGWPTTPVKSVLQGQGVPQAGGKPSSGDPSVAADVSLAETSVTLSTGTTLTQNSNGSFSESGGTQTPTGQNQRIGQMLAANYGWNTGQQWNDLVKLWNMESGWNNVATNPTSGAYGIAQALPASKYPPKGRPPSMGGKSDATTQIQWGLQYIAQRYGSPSAALAHELSTNPHWY